MKEIQRGQTWECNEARAEPDSVPEPHDTVDLWPDYPRFAGVVDRVVEDVVEMTVGTSNSHPRAPELGQTVYRHVDKVRERDRWRLKSDGGQTAEVVTA